MLWKNSKTSLRSLIWADFYEFHSTKNGIPLQRFAIQRSWNISPSQAASPPRAAQSHRKSPKHTQSASDDWSSSGQSCRSQHSPNLVNRKLHDLNFLVFMSVQLSLPVCTFYILHSIQTIKLYMYIPVNYVNVWMCACVEKVQVSEHIAQSLSIRAKSKQPGQKTRKWRDK